MTYTLHHGAAELLELFGVVYWHTDGCLVPARQAAGVIENLGEEWGLEARIKAEGRGEVCRLGAYRIGECRLLVKGSERNVEYLLPDSSELASRLKAFRRRAVAAQDGAAVPCERGTLPSKRAARPLDG